LSICVPEPFLYIYQNSTASAVEEPQFLFPRTESNFYHRNFATVHLQAAGNCMETTRMTDQYALFGVYSKAKERG
jgi:hypothetical protein